MVFKCYPIRVMDTFNGTGRQHRIIHFIRRTNQARYARALITEVRGTPW